MGKILQVILAIMFVSFLVGLFSSSLYRASTDVNKTQFVLYQEVKSHSNLSYNTTENNNQSYTTLSYLAEKMADEVKNAQTGIQSDNPIEKLSSAFGVFTALTMNVLLLFFHVLIEFINVLFGFQANVNALPFEFRIIGQIIFFGLAVGMVYIIVNIINAYIKWDI